MNSKTSNEEDSHLGTRLRNYMLQHHISIKELSEQINRSRQSIHNYLQSDTFTYQQAQTLSNALKVPLSFFGFDEVSKSRNNDGEMLYEIDSMASVEEQEGFIKLFFEKINEQVNACQKSIRLVYDLTNNKLNRHSIIESKILKYYTDQYKSYSNNIEKKLIENPNISYERIFQFNELGPEIPIDEVQRRAVSYMPVTTLQHLVNLSDKKRPYEVYLSRSSISMTSIFIIDDTTLILWQFKMFGKHRLPSALRIRKISEDEFSANHRSTKTLIREIEYIKKGGNEFTLELMHQGLFLLKTYIQNKKKIYAKIKTDVQVTNSLEEVFFLNGIQRKDDKIKIEEIDLDIKMKIMEQRIDRLKNQFSKTNN